ncbi:glycosyltransferase family 4 protein [Haladaptatus sp. NG-SE-30]
MSNEQRLRQRVNNTSRSQGEFEEQSDERAAQLSIGMYYRKAGTRDAGGIVMYTQEMIDAVADHHRAYLYTEAGELTPKMQRTDAEIISISPAATDGLSGAVAKRIPLPDSSVLSMFQERLPTLVGGIRDGMIQHMNEHVDVLLTHNFFDDIVLSNLLDIPVIRIYHGFQHVGIGSKAHELLSTSHSIVNSVQTEMEFVEQLGYEPDGIVYPGVDIERFSPDAPPAFDRDEWTILFVGRFTEAKGLYDLIDAVSRLRDDVHLYLVGRGDRAALTEQIESSGLESSVTIEGPVQHDELPRYYAAADVFCLPSHYESFGMVNLEAMACGTPVVTTDLAGITEYAVDRESAMVVPPKRPDALAEAIETALSSTEIRTRLVEQGRATAKRYSWEMSSKNLLNTCLEIDGENGWKTTSARSVATAEQPASRSP